MFAVSMSAQWCHVKNRDMLDVIDIYSSRYKVGFRYTERM